MSEFMDDMVSVRILPTLHADCVEPLNITIGDKTETLYFGKSKKVPRRFVERLANMRMVTDAQANKYHLLYPFAIVSDPAGAVGRDWLKGILGL